ncbi:RNA polymerase sigma-70 factor (ECF subfamily) [Naumannella halotolerans]|uniref:RNA polymerase sigma-70 factor (ECF subfamily) n=2 Tax=Naumannella halotolerans TaxID=993414 RepID=A0A4R7J8E9_9ACTN|nr:RNA polymerase sigma-70 factor (ECF subfamily) [Naumannella halotolerans]
MAAGASMLRVDDATLVLRARDGGTEAFDQIVDRYQGPLYRHALRMVNDSSDAEDITQDVLVGAWRRLEQLRDPSSLRSWLYRSSTHRCLDQLRSRRPSDSLDDTVADGRPLGDRVADHHPWPDRSAISKAEWEALVALVRRLPPTQRAVWLLSEIDGFSYEEVAVIVRTTPDGVRGRLARARVALARGMVDWK